MEHRDQNWKCSVSSDPPDVKISQHLQIDNGFWDALDAVVVEVERLEGGEQTHFWRDFCEAILGQICKAKEQLMKYVHFEHAGDTHYNLFKIGAPSIMFALGRKTNQYVSVTERFFIEHRSKITPESWAWKVWVLLAV